ncbi:MAG: hypothetical protein MKZ95_12670 [Pirellulales bacterium]|nr:hypothetical protein [Pirellulales bacterium]
MDITAEQKNKITEWVRQGEDLRHIQSLLKDELNINITYVETRFLLADLGLEPGDEEEEEQEVTAEVEESSSPVDEADSPADDIPPPADQEIDGGGNVAVTVDSLMKPGAVITGKVTFSDGEAASWLIDQMGQLRLDPETENYRPSAEDIQKFQMELQKAASSQGL